MDTLWDCIIVGGGAAGLSAGLVLGRARRHTLLVDAGEQSNLAAHGIGGLLGHDGRSPAELYATGRRELAAYPSVELRTGEVVSGERIDGVFVLELGDGRRERTRRVLLATGMEYRPPPLPGLAALWGRSVFHCPFCHGWEAREQPLAVFAQGGKAVHAALLLRGWSDDIVLLTDGPAGLDDDDRLRLATAGVRIDERPVAELAAARRRIGGHRVRRRESIGTSRAAGRHYSAPAVSAGANSSGAGLWRSDPGWPWIPSIVDALHRTTAPGVFAAGDVSAHMPQVAAAIAAGSLAATAVVQSLLAEDVGLPVPAWREKVDV